MRVGTTVLVADDDEDALELLSLVLRSRGFDVRECRNGLELVEAARELSPGCTPIILADLEMPEMDGVEAVRKIDAMPLSKKVYFMTALREAPLLSEAQSMGNVVFHKPLDVEKLVETLEGAAA